MSACSATAGSLSAVGTPVAVPPSRVLSPSCGPAVGKIEVGFDTFIPRDIATIVGFTPLLPARLPNPLTWSMVVIAGRTWTLGPAPFFHAAYGIWFLRPYNTYALHTVLALDESTEVFAPDTDIALVNGSLSLARQSSLVIDGTPATLDTLTSSPQPGHAATQILAITWREDGIFLRLSAVSTGSYALFAAAAGEDTVVAWAPVSARVLEQLAASVKLYGGCGDTAP
ncbi:MAG: hypothetical protein ACLQUY_08935 [Ktedonobacterales bacterium]